MVRLLLLFIKLSILQIAFCQADIKSLEKLLQNASSINQKAYLHYAIADNYILSANYTKACEHTQEAIALCEKYNIDSTLYKSYVLMGRIFFYQKNFSKSIAYYDKALALAPQNPLYNANYYKQIGDIYLVENKKDSAKILYEKTLHFYNQIHYKDDLALAKFYANYSILFENDFIKKIEYALLADKHFTIINEANIINVGNLGNAYKDIVLLNLYDSLHQLSSLIPPTRAQNIEKAYYYVQKAIQLAKVNKDIDNEAYFTGILSEIQVLEQDYKNAYYNITHYYETMDSIYSQENKNKLANIESELEIAKKNAQIATQKRIRFGLFIGLFLLSIIGLLLYQQARNRKLHIEKLAQLNAELFQANQTKTKLFNIINHDLRSPIANIITFLQLQKNIDDSTCNFTLSTQRDKLLIDTENLLENMDTMLFWGKGQMSNFKPQFKQVLIADLFNYLKRFFSSIAAIEFQYISEEVEYIYTDENFMQIIMQNLTNNAIKALKGTHNPTIIWKAFLSSNNVILQITDNGPGIDEEKLQLLLSENKIQSQKNGLGLQIINEMAKIINCKLNFKTSTNQGFTVSILLHNSTKN